MSPDDSRPGAPAPYAEAGERVEPVGAGGLGAVPALVTSPTEAFRRIAADPKWIGNAILIFLLLAAASWIQLPQQIALQEEMTIASLEKFGAPEEAVDEALAKLPDPDDPGGGEVARNAATMLIPTFFLVIVGGTLVHLLARIAGCMPRWTTSVSMFTLVSVVSGLGALVKACLIRASGTMEVTLGPGSLIPGLDWHSVPSILLDLFDVFALWALVLLATGCRVVFRASPGKAWGIAGTYWILKSLVVFLSRAAMAWVTGAI